jgi:hypothetical protein
MTVKVRVTCLNSLGLPNLQTFIQGHNTKFWAKCPRMRKATSDTTRRTLREG